MPGTTTGRDSRSATRPRPKRIGIFTLHYTQIKDKAMIYQYLHTHAPFGGWGA
jgi:hypothetical protein